MAITTRLDGAKHTIISSAGTLIPQGTITLRAAPRIANARGGGDAAPVPKPIGMDDGAELSSTVLSTSRTLLTLNGGEETLTVMDGATTVETVTGIMEVEYSADTGGMVQFGLRLMLTALPASIGAKLGL